jgi:hypothetical protein
MNSQDAAFPTLKAQFCQDCELTVGISFPEITVTFLFLED